MTIPVGDFEPELAIRVRGDRAALRGGAVSADFDVWRTHELTIDDVERLSPQSDAAARPLLVLFERASREAREALRARRISYASDGGELFVLTPQMLIDRPRPARSATPSALSEFEAAGGVSPFAKRASRVPRWLLLHPDDELTIGELAAETQLSRPFTSQVVRSLAERALVDLASAPTDGRVRRVRLTRPAELLDAWAAEWQRRKRREVTWDIGTSEVSDTLAAWADAARHAESRPWALGGLAGAERLVRAVDPTDVLVWIDPVDLEAWQELLLPERRRRGQAPLRVAAAPDPWTLGLADPSDQIRIADPVQLYLDCRSEGERALEAAAAIRRQLGW